jgi:parvulin-like peptidyl-prolyl isomerase
MDTDKKQTEKNHWLLSYPCIQCHPWLNLFAWVATQNGVVMKTVWLSVLLAVAWLPMSSLFGGDEAARVVAKVNGKAITAGDVEFAAVTQQVKPEDRTAQETQLIERLIERQLVREFLAKRKIQAPADDVQFQIQHAESVLKKLGEDPEAFLAKLGYTSERLKQELGLPLAWQVYVRQTVTTPQVREFFEQHRAEFDGTQLRARQVFFKRDASAPDSNPAATVARMKELREQIVSGKLTFPDAAKQFSEAPSREQGGDVGRFGFRGKLPAPVAQAAFALKVSEISEPIVSTFGVHLIQVTERHPGDLSLEDVRPQIVERLADQLWQETISRERKIAKIESSLK